VQAGTPPPQEEKKRSIIRSGEEGQFEAQREREKRERKEEIMPKLQCVISCLCAHSRWVICSLFPNRESPSRDKI
jgi:hypothetical protein